MLLLSRKPGQALEIGEAVEITLLEVRGDTIRLGIQAPRDVPVLRKEVYLQVAEANRSASGADPEAVTRAGQIRPVGAPAATRPPGVITLGGRRDAT